MTRSRQQRPTGKAAIGLSDRQAVARLMRSITDLRRERPHADPCDFLFDLAEEIEEIHRNDLRFPAGARQGL